MSARPGNDGKLTNQACTQYKGDVCQTWSVKTYDLSDANFRQTANQSDFVCKIGGKRYKICKDQPGFCRISYSCDSNFLWWCTDQKENVEFLPITPYQNILDLNTKCFSENVYNWPDIQ